MHILFFNMVCYPVTNDCLIFNAEMNLSQLLYDESFEDWTVGTKKVVPDPG